MAKITTIIDIGSNSMRMVVLKKTSRFAFHLINETKSKVKISEGCYENNGNLQPEPLNRAFNALISFIQIAKNLKSGKILCVATSALRDAPNGNTFVKKVSCELGLNIKIIDGQKEAYYGGVAALNLLDCDNFATIDIGGGSTEFAFINDRNITDTVSLNIGTIRLKELYFNKNDLDGAKDYILSQLKNIEHKPLKLVGMGGTARALSRAIINKEQYCFDMLHGFKYNTKNNYKLFNNIITANSNKKLKDIGIRKDRYDTIKEGTFIFKTILEFFQIKEVITSGVGVREGIYLTDLLRSSNHKFPVNFNISIRSLLDRFVDDDKLPAYLGNNAKKIFDVLKPLHTLDDKYKSILVIASKLQPMGISLNFYKNSEHSFNFILNGLSYGFTHERRLLIAHIIKFSKKSLPKQSEIKEYKQLLPDFNVIQWLSFMISLNICLNSDFSRTKFEYKLGEDTLEIECDKDIYITQKALEKIETPVNLNLELI
ncbi:MAG: Ppx/GppA family phosphatase [Arcobacteraceae bacterium]|nr:Ppx/GppA family phosphatase [Arcobacteraceae bacterium]